MAPSAIPIQPPSSIAPPAAPRHLGMLLLLLTSDLALAGARTSTTYAPATTAEAPTTTAACPLGWADNGVHGCYLFGSHMTGLSWLEALELY